MLLSFHLNSERTNHLLDLLYYVYTEDGVQGVSKLKEMVLLYVAAHVGTVRKDERFRLMMNELPQLGADMVYTLPGNTD